MESRYDRARRALARLESQGFGEYGTGDHITACEAVTLLREMVDEAERPLTALANRAAACDRRRGLFDKTTTLPEQVALIHEEVSEVLKAWREGADPGIVYDTDDGPEGVDVELADVVLRAASFAHRYLIDLDRAVKAKREFNATRPRNARRI